MSKMVHNKQPQPFPNTPIMIDIYVKVLNKVLRRPIFSIRYLRVYFEIICLFLVLAEVMYLYFCNQLLRDLHRSRQATLQMILLHQKEGWSHKIQSNYHQGYYGTKLFYTRFFENLLRFSLQVDFMIH